MVKYLSQTGSHALVFLSVVDFLRDINSQLCSVPRVC